MLVKQHKSETDAVALARDAVIGAFQREHPCPSTGQTTGPPPRFYRKDHVVPLECGGPDIVSSLQWQTIRDARAKDTRELKAWVLS